MARPSCLASQAKALQKALLYARQDSNLRPLAPEAERWRFPKGIAKELRMSDGAQLPST